MCRHSALNCIKSIKFSSSSVEHLTTCKMILQPDSNQLRVQGQYDSEGRCQLLITINALTTLRTSHIDGRIFMVYATCYHGYLHC